VAIDVEDRGTLGGNSGRAEPVRLVLAS
jgi:hypothetical protein